MFAIFYRKETGEERLEFGVWSLGFIVRRSLFAGRGGLTRRSPSTDATSKIADCEFRITDLCLVGRLKPLLQIQSAIRNPKSEIVGSLRLCGETPSDS